MTPVTVELVMCIDVPCMGFDCCVHFERASAHKTEFIFLFHFTVWHRCTLHADAHIVIVEVYSSTTVLAWLFGNLKITELHYTHQALSERTHTRWHMITFRFGNVIGWGKVQSPVRWSVAEKWRRVYVKWSCFEAHNECNHHTVYANGNKSNMMKL